MTAVSPTYTSATTRAYQFPVTEMKPRLRAPDKSRKRFLRFVSPPRFGNSRRWQSPRDISNPARDPVGGDLERVVRKVRVARGCFYLVVTEQFPDHGKPFPDQKTATRVAVPEVMKAHVLDPGTAANPVPLVVDIAQRRARLRPDDCPRIAVLARRTSQHFNRRVAQMDDLGAGLLPPLGHRVVVDGADASRRRAHVRVGKMGVALGRAGIGVTEEAAHGVEVEAPHHGKRGQRMATVVDAYAVEPGQVAQGLPAPSEVGHRPVARPAREHERAAARQAVQHRAGVRRELDRLRSGLGMGSTAPVPRIQSHLRPVISKDRAPVNSISRMAAASCGSSAWSRTKPRRFSSSSYRKRSPGFMW